MTAPLATGPDHRAASRTAATSSFALMLSAIGTAATTYLFWVLLARTEDAATVGLAGGQIATITFLGNAASLNLINVLSRFLPVAGTSARRLICYSYAAAAACASLVAVGFVLTPWGAEASAGISRPGFVAMVVVSSVFLAQNGALVGLARASSVPVANIGMGCLRLALLPICAAFAAGAGGAVWAWGIAAGVTVVALNAAVLGRWAPHARGPCDLPAPRQLAAFVAVDAPSMAVTYALTTFLPAVVTFAAGADVGGYFYVPWMVLSIATLLVSNVLLAAVRESVADPHAARSVLRSQLRLCTVLVAAVTAACLVLPQVPLLLLGGEFAHEAEALVRWLGLSLPGTTVVLTLWAICLIRQRPWPMLAVNVVIAAATLLPIAIAGAQLGVTGIGALHCVVQTTAGLAVLPYVVRRLHMLTSQE